MRVSVLGSAGEFCARNSRPVAIRLRNRNAAPSTSSDARQLLRNAPTAVDPDVADQVARAQVEAW